MRKDRLTEGIGRYGDKLPDNIPPGIAGEPGYQVVAAEVSLHPGAAIEAHACDVCASVEIGYSHHQLRLKGSFEQLRYVLRKWLELLDSIEAEAEGREEATSPTQGNGMA